MLKSQKLNRFVQRQDAGGTAGRPVTEWLNRKDADRATVAHTHSISLRPTSIRKD